MPGFGHKLILTHNNIDLRSKADGKNSTLWEEATRKSMLRLFTSTTIWGTLWQASKSTLAPTACAQLTTVSIGRTEAVAKGNSNEGKRFYYNSRSKLIIQDQNW